MPIAGDSYAFTDANISKSPDKAGVYALYDGSTLIYYGRAQGNTTTIRTRLQDHKAGRGGACTKGATQYRREPCSNPADREVELLAEYKRLSLGRLPRCNERVG